MSLGVTTFEPMPIHTFVDDSYLLDKGLKTIGAITDGFFAPDSAMLRLPNCVAGIQGDGCAVHDAGLDVILDVVYNHTAEGNELGPTLRSRASTTVAITGCIPDNKRYYINDTGTGNTVNLSHPRVIQMVTDSLRYWVSKRSRRFSIRPGNDSGAGAEWLRQQERLPEGGKPGPDSNDRETHRRTMGLRSGRLSGGRIPSWLGGVE